MEQIKERGCTVAVSATTFLQMVMDVYDPAVHDIGTMRLWVAAGAPIPASFVTKAAELFPGLQVLSLYGRSENVTTTMCTVDDEPERSLTSDGRPLPLQSVKIVDELGNEVPRGEEGDVATRAPCTCSGISTIPRRPPSCSPPTATPSPGISAGWTRTATCGSPAGPRTS